MMPCTLIVKARDTDYTDPDSLFMNHQIYKVGMVVTVHDYMADTGTGSHASDHLKVVHCPDLSKREALALIEEPQGFRDDVPGLDPDWAKREYVLDLDLMSVPQRDDITKDIATKDATLTAAEFRKSFRRRQPLVPE